MATAKPSPARSRRHRVNPSCPVRAGPASRRRRKFPPACHIRPANLVMAHGIPGRWRMTMTPRLNAFAAAPVPMQMWLDFGKRILESGLEESLTGLVKIRASQINGCAFCLDMHATEARRKGEFEQRIYLLDAWRESPLYSERERAALAWTEALTRLPETHAPDEAYRALHAQFTEEEQVKLTLLIITINGWNRLQVGFRATHSVGEQRAN